MISKKDILTELCILSDNLSELESRVIKLEKHVPMPKVGRPKKSDKK